MRYRMNGDIDDGVNEYDNHKYVYVMLHLYVCVCVYVFCSCSCVICEYSQNA